jgi:serine/threonine protein kinase
MMEPAPASQTTRMVPASLGRYRLDGVLGSGGMGTVHRAYDPIIGRTVAIKVMRTAHIDPDQRAEFLDRFAQEVRAAAGCTHPAIIAVHDVGGDLKTGAADHPPFIVMELVEGQSLAEWLRDPERRVVLSPQAVLLPILDALESVHRLGIVHRDVKPGNILLTPQRQPKLTDFGIARLNHSGFPQPGITSPGMMIGTPWYMAPEQARGEDIDQRADLFSVGCIIYEMLAGQTPFGSNSIGETVFRLLGPQPVRLDPIARLAPQFTAVLARALAKSAGERFASATEFAAALRAVDQAPAVSSDLTIASPPRAVPSYASERPGPFEPEFLTTLGNELATWLGPIAPTLVRRAAEQAVDRESLRRKLATHLELPETRSIFLRRTGMPMASPRDARGLPLRPATANASIPDQAVAAAQKVLAERIGPIATLVTKRAASTATNQADFIEMIAVQFPADKELRRSLQQAMQVRS